MPGSTTKNQFYRSVVLTVCYACFFISATSAQPIGRSIISLNDQWQFSKDKSAWEHVNLPHTWNAKDVMDDEPGYYRGIGWYKRKLSIGDSLKSKKIFISFNGADQETEVYINGKLAGAHIGGYTKFIIPVSDYLNYKNDEIEVKVNNRFNEDIAPLTADFTFFGGIYRNVNLLVTEPVHFSQHDKGSSGVYVTTPQVSAASATVQVRSLIENESSANRKV